MSQKNIINDNLLKYEEKSNNNYWITNDTNSCRYDALVFIYCKEIQPFIEQLDKTEYLISLNRISTELMNIKDEDKKLGFWNILKEYNLDYLDIFNEKISHIFLVILI